MKFAKVFLIIIASLGLMNSALAATATATATAAVTTAAAATETDTELKVEQPTLNEKNPAIAARDEKLAAELAKTDLAKPDIAKAENILAKKEAEIPVVLEKTKEASASGFDFGRILFSISILGILCVGTYLLYRRAKTFKKNSPATQIKVISQHFLGPKKSLAIVRVAGESILIGITDHNVSMIKSLALLDEDIPEEVPNDFGSLMGKISFNKQTQGQTFKESSKPSPHQYENSQADDGEDFAMTGIKQIKDVVSQKLKNMRSI